MLILLPRIETRYFMLFKRRTKKMVLLFLLILLFLSERETNIGIKFENTPFQAELHKMAEESVNRKKNK